MKRISKVLSLYFLIFLTSCGYKVANQLENNRFNIAEIKTIGDSRINYNIKNKLLFNSKKEHPKRLSIIINTEKSKTIKEKNIKNQITKYEIVLKVNISLREIDNNKQDQFYVSKSSSYDVAKQYSQTLNNEKKLIELMTDSIVELIVEEISLRLNDL
tara:strand:- start:85 stop:558 length:474 start_codon:yes stop_codon:yes gene_type:complete